MLNLSRKLVLNATTIASANLCGEFDKADLDAIGNYVWEGYSRDRFSRLKWSKRNEAALDLATQIQKDKNFPWAGASNVAFPLVTIAALQFHARAYPTIMSGTDVVRCRVIGEDSDGQKKARADRISTYMSWQVLEEDQAWEEQQDRLLVCLPIVGCVFKKSYYSAARGHSVGEMVAAQDLVLDYYAKSVESAMRKTQIIPLYRNEIHERILRGAFRDVREEPWYAQAAKPLSTPELAKRDQRLGQAQPQADDEAPFNALEQHVSLDLDDDGYAEPYIISIEEGSKTCLRIVTRFDRPEDIERNSKGEIISIRAMEYFTKYPFIPSPDGGIYDMGFGVLLGPLNESVNSLINQLIDAGTMSNTAGGFLGRGAKIRGGVYTFAPLEWKRVDSTGDDLHKSIFPLPVREPSQVLFQLLGLLIEYTNRVSGATDTMLGENPGQNTPASNMQTMVEQGMKIYNAIFKRVWRSMKGEFKKLYILNSIYLPALPKPFGTGTGKISREDFLGNPDAVVPSADPNVTSESAQVQRAVMLKQAAAGTPGYSIPEVEMRFLKALKIEAPEQVYPGPEKIPPGEDVKITIKKMDLQVKQMALQQDQLEFQFEKQKFVATLMEEQRVNSASIAQMEANAAQLMAKAQGADREQQIAAMDAAIGLAKTRDEHIRTQIDLLLKPMEIALAHRQIDVKHRELDVKEKEIAKPTPAK